MKELNELVELAKRARFGHFDYSRFTAAIEPETLLAIAEGFRALEQENIVLKQGCENNPLVHEMIDWRERAEAAEAKVKELEEEQAEHDQQIATLQGKFDLALAGLRSKTSRCDKAEAKLAELAQQKPIGWLNDAYLGRGVIDGEVGQDDFGPGYIPIYRQPFNDVPAPAVSLAPQQPADDGWIEWGGGECPLHPSTRVHVKFSSGDEDIGRSEFFVWGKGSQSYGVIAYRVVKP